MDLFVSCQQEDLIPESKTQLNTFVKRIKKGLQKN